MARGAERQDAGEAFQGLDVGALQDATRLPEGDEQGEPLVLPAGHGGEHGAAESGGGETDRARHSGGQDLRATARGLGDLRLGVGRKTGGDAPGAVEPELVAAAGLVEVDGDEVRLRHPRNLARGVVEEDVEVLDLEDRPRELGHQTVQIAQSRRSLIQWVPE